MRWTMIKTPWGLVGGWEKQQKSLEKTPPKTNGWNPKNEDLEDGFSFF